MIPIDGMLLVVVSCLVVAAVAAGVTESSNSVSNACSTTSFTGLSDGASSSLTNEQLEKNMERKEDTQHVFIPHAPSWYKNAAPHSFGPPTVETCNASVVVSHNMTAYWMSPNYDGGSTSYGDDTYTCQLTLTIPAETLYILNMDMQSPSELFDTTDCTGDCLIYNSMGSLHRYCGEMSSLQWTEMQLYEPKPKTVTLTFMSKNSDNGTQGGFNLKITAMEVASHEARKPVPRN